MNDIYSFYQLISKFQIEIPIIQRDYAQGRDNPKAQDIRKSMVTDLIAAVKDGKKLFFDFVYGRIDENKFIPFDGQQRLTTLFLFHKYVFEKCQFNSTCEYKTKCICKDILLRFSYATRQSSREFCEQLVSHSVIPSKDYHKRIKDEYLQTLKDKQESEAEFGKKADEYVAGKTDWTSGFIKNQSWFYSDWEKDPTIMGMLIMLDEIHNQFTKNEINDYKPLAEKLTSGCSCPITFHFVDMGEHKLSDETYVKMNARGKTLTPFENFKASLEQYLESKKEDHTLSRLKDNADGKWLDLFFKKVKEKELPDDAMMSFFNRHLMNVWRCWYENKTKSENERKNSINDEIEKQKEYDNFNKRIVAEMPLYPTKDDFVSWDIYQNVLENCGVDECLTPIFNIWDELCKEPEHIIENSQSVWNRGEGNAKWILYEGTKNNENRETYPSRVAFYALLRYFGVKKEKTKTTLAQWMRIVWNLVENSTIDSPETYHAALRLINKLSTKCYDIHDALANCFEEFDLGSQYHAQEQLQEEIAKAKQILNNDCELCKKFGKNDKHTWEEIIIEAEKYAFFKGAIRFLFTDGEGNINWCDFDTKWINAKKYFDKNGVKNEFYNNALLLRYYISFFKEWWMFWNFEYNGKDSTWKDLLTSKRHVPNHNLLVAPPNDQVLILFSSTLDKYDDGFKERQENVHNELVNTNIIQKTTEWNVRLNWRYNNYCLYPYNTRALWKIYVIANPRNNILSKLYNDKKITSNQKIDGCQFFWGWDINFRYKDHDFQWTTHSNVYLMEKGERRSSFKPSDKIDYTGFIEKLNEIISQADSEQSSNYSDSSSID